MFSMKKNKLLVSIDIYIQEMHMIFNNINVYGEEIREREHHDVSNKIKLGFEIGLPVNDKNNFQKQQYQLQSSRRLFILLTMIFI